MAKSEKIIVGIIRFIIEVTKTTHDIFIRESMYNKNLRMMGVNPQKYWKTMNDLSRRGIVKYNAERSAHKLSKKGLGWLTNSKIKYFKHFHGKWDGKWRIVLFDIPNELHNKRNSLRRKLKALDFAMIQHSVFAIPFPCEEVVSNICSGFKIDDYVDIIVADSVGSRTDELREYYKL